MKIAIEADMAFKHQQTNNSSSVNVVHGHKQSFLNDMSIKVTLSFILLGQTYQNSFRGKKKPDKLFVMGLIASADLF